MSLCADVGQGEGALSEMDDRRLVQHKITLNAKARSVGVFASVLTLERRHSLLISTVLDRIFPFWPSLAGHAHLTRPARSLSHNTISSRI